jgi:hypothetical protein
MRSDPAEFWRKTSSPWHYVTVPPGRTYAEADAPPEGDAVTALRRFPEHARQHYARLASLRTTVALRQSIA